METLVPGTGKAPSVQGKGLGLLGVWWFRGLGFRGLGFGSLGFGGFGVSGFRVRERV